MRDCPGVYVGTCIPTGKKYVGSSLKVRARIIEHKVALARGNHANKYLQFAYNKYGAKNFRWRLLVTNPDNRFEEEQAWIVKLRAHDRRYGFNCSFPVRANEPHPMASARLKALWADPEYRALCEAGLLNGSRKVSKRLKDDPKFAAKMSRIRRKQFSTDAKMSISVKAKARYKDPEYKAQLAPHLARGRQRLQQLRKDPKFLDKQVKGMVDRWKDPKARELQAKRMAALWDNPEFRAKQIAKSRKIIMAVNKAKKRAAERANARYSPTNHEK